MKRQTLIAALVSGLSGLMACSDTTLPKYENLGGLRILALRADQATQFSGVAEFSAGDTVVVTPYVSSYSLSGSVSYLARACTDPGVSAGATPSCEGVAGAVVVGSGTVSLTGGGSNTGEANALSVTIPSDVLSGRSSSDQYNGVSYLFEYKLTSADGRSTSAIKRLIVSSAAKTKNANPTLTGLVADGASFTALPAAAVNVGISYPAGARETYTVMLADGTLLPQTEDLLTTYFITDGSLKYIRTIDGQTTTYTPPSPAPVDHSVVMVAVVRDPRGGVAVSVVKLN